jgi:hypothetical protein
MMAVSAATIRRKLLPVGRAYLAHVRREIDKLTFEEYDEHEEEERKRQEMLNGDALNPEDDLGVGDEEETLDLLSLDPKEWKVCVFLKEVFPCYPFLIIESHRRSQKSETRSLRCPGFIPPALPSHASTNQNCP